MILAKPFPYSALQPLSSQGVPGTTLPDAISIMPTTMFSANSVILPPLTKSRAINVNPNTGQAVVITPYNASIA